MYTEEQLRQIFRALVNENDEKINSLYYNDVSNRLGFSSPDEKREEFYVTKEIARYVTTGPNLIHSFLGQSFIQKTSSEETTQKYLQLKNQGKDWKDFLPTSDLLKYFTFQNDVISNVFSKQASSKEVIPVEELFLTTMPLTKASEFFKTSTILQEDLDNTYVADLQHMQFDDVQQAILQGVSDIYLSQEIGDKEVYSYSLDPNFSPENFKYFPSEATMDSLNLNEYHTGINLATASYIVDKLRFNLDKSCEENIDTVVGQPNFSQTDGGMVEN